MASAKKAKCRYLPQITFCREKYERPKIRGSSFAECDLFGLGSVSLALGEGRHSGKLARSVG